MMALAHRPSLPVLERVSVLAAFSNNRDDFFQVRLGIPRLGQQAGFAVRGSDHGQTAQLRSGIGGRVRELVTSAGRVFTQQLVPDLAAAGIHLPDTEAVSDEARFCLDALFAADILPILTPLAVDPA